MANVLFKRGLQAALPAQGSAQDGVFYLTQDTNRLYIGEGTSLKLLNQTVQIVASLNELLSKSNGWDAAAKADHRNDFYYIPAHSGDSTNTHGGNILVVWDGSAWVQINPDTDTKINSIDFGTSAANNIATVTLTATDSETNTIGSSTDAANPDSFTITGAGSVYVTAENKNITLSGETYTLGKAVSNDQKTATIQLNANEHSNQSSTLPITGGANVTFTSTQNGFRIDSIDTQNSSGTLTMPSDGSLAFSVVDTNTNPVGATLENVGIAVGASTGNVGNYYLPITNTYGKTAANIYTAAEIDSLINGLDGMTFKGTLGDSGSATIQTLPTTGVRHGDTYVIVKNGMVASQFSNLDTTTAAAMSNGTSIGDMLIARGTEENGVITSGLNWVYVPSGNEAAEVYTYSGIVNESTNTAGVENGSHTVISSHSLTAGTDINISSTATGVALESTISHATYANVTPVADSTPADGVSSFTAITGINLTNGHVTGITTNTFTPVTYALSGAEVTEGTRFGASSTTNDITATISLADDGGTPCGSADVKLSSSSITLTRSNDNIVMDLVWGSF